MVERRAKREARVRGKSSVPPAEGAPRRARRAKPNTLAHEVFGENLEQLALHIDRNGRAGLKSLYMEARGELQQRLAQHRGQEALNLRAMLAQTDAMLASLGKGLKKRLDDVGKTAVELGAEHGLVEFNRLATHFEGKAPVLDLEKAAVFAGLVRGVDKSLLRRRAGSTDAWSRSQVAQVEQRLRVGVATKRGADQIAADIAGDLEIEGWRAERIVRTETAFAANAAKQAVIEDIAAQTTRPMKKKLIEPYVPNPDGRTGQDSFLVHGQVVPVGAPFKGWLKRGDGWREITYLFPPNRPNDRAYIIAWDPAWDETELTRVLSNGEIRALRIEPPSGRSAAGLAG